MKSTLHGIQRFLRDEDGVVAIEYGLIAILIALAIIVGATALGVGLNTMFANIAACFNPGGVGVGTCSVGPFTP